MDGKPREPGGAVGGRLSGILCQFSRYLYGASQYRDYD